MNKAFKTSSRFELTIKHISKFHFFSFEQTIKINHYQQISIQLECVTAIHLRTVWWQCVLIISINIIRIFQNFNTHIQNNFDEFKMSKNDAIRSQNFMTSSTSFDFKACQCCFLTLNLSNDEAVQMWNTDFLKCLFNSHYLSATTRNDMTSFDW